MTQVVPSSGGNVYVASDALVQTIAEFTAASSGAVQSLLLIDSGSGGDGSTRYLTVLEDGVAVAERVGVQALQRAVRRVIRRRQQPRVVLCQARAELRARRVDLCEVFVHLVQADRVAPRPGIQIPMCRFLHGDRLLQ